jgi:predicted Ser/Thr protein kinase
MGPERYALVADLLSGALDRPDAEREAFLSARCPDPSIRAEVLDLLRVEREGGPFSEDRVEARRRELASLFETPVETGAPMPDSIGSYRVIRRIGEGGMGVVFEAEQASPRRRVAVKVVDSVRVGSGLEKRLRQEAEIQGRLQHPGIAQIYEAGAAPVGESVRPFFAMEYIEGESIAIHAESLGLRGKMELLAGVASAVGFAHAKGVVHRDLKPDNIMVLPSGQPKVLDFGIAQLAGDTTLGLMTITQQGQFAGTIGYMAPEQFAGDADRVGPPADVYALGVIAYELVAGRPPLEIAGLSIAGAIRAIEQGVPESLRSACPGVPRDLETIVHRCLDPDPARRYRDASALASDLRRLLADQPIVARRPTRRYRAAKFVRRNRLLVGGVGATVASLVIGLVATGYFASGQHRARLEAEREREFASQKELDAVRGVLAGASLLAERGEIWEAVRQLHAVAPSTRGWAWRHTALGLPWVVEHPAMRPDLDTTGSLRPVGFVDEERVVFLTRPGGEAILLDVPEGAWQPIPTETRFLQALEPVRAGGGRVALFDGDGRAGLLDAKTGVFTPVGAWESNPLPPDGSGLFPGLVMSDPDTMLLRSRKIIEVLTPGLPPLRLGDDTPDVPHAGPWWEIATPPAGSAYLVLGRWALGDRGAEIVCIDRRTNTVVSASPASWEIPTLAMDADGQRVYTRSASGLDILAVPSLDRVGAVEGVGSALNLVPMAGGGTAFVAHTTETLHMLDRAGDLTAWPEPIGAESFQYRPLVAPDGRLLLASTPNDLLPWIIDTAHPIDPMLRGVTALAGHASWVYQVAMSPDGSLLASAAPLGDVLLWDLHAGRLLARVARPASRDPRSLPFHMDAPLLFDARGEALIFGEFDLAERAFGLSTLDLRTGERKRTVVGSRAALHERIAALVDWVPGPLYHHAAVLPGRRILETASSLYFPQRVVVRGASRADGAGAEIELTASRAEIPGGVAVHPDGTRFVLGDTQQLSVRDARTLETVATLTDAGTTRVYGVAYSPDGEHLAIGTGGGAVLIYETRFHKRIAEIRPPQFEGTEPAPEGSERDYIYALAWTPDGTRLVCSGGETIRVLESERPFIRDRKRDAWEANLRAAREGKLSSPAAARITTIERLVREGVIK